MDEDIRRVIGACRK